jgi:hypothetical protein
MTFLHEMEVNSLRKVRKERSVHETKYRVG